MSSLLKIILLSLVAALTSPAVECVAHCSLKGVFIPDGAFTDSAGVTISLSTQVPPSREFSTISGRVSLALNQERNAGTWQSSGVLEEIQGTSHGQAWLAGQPVFIDANFEIPFDAPLGDSVIHLSMSVGGRRVHQYFSDEHAVSGLGAPIDQSDFGFRVHRIEAPATQGTIRVEFLSETSLLTARATDSTFQPKCTEKLDSETPCSVLIEGVGDASMQFIGGTSFHMQAFTYHDFTIFQNAKAGLTSTGRGILAVQGFRSNFRLTQTPVPIIQTLSLERISNELHLKWIGMSEELLQLESSNDLKTWSNLNAPFTSSMGENSRMIPPLDNTSERTRFFRLSKTP